MKSSPASYDAKRGALIESVADFLLSRGLDAAGLRALAHAAGTSDRMLLYYFKDKDALIMAALEHVGARLTLILASTTPVPLPYDQALTRLSNRLLADDLWPYMQLWLELAARAARGDALCCAVGEAIGRGFHDWAGAQIATADDAARPAMAARLLVAVEGMVLLKSIGMADVSRLAASDAPS